MALQRIEEAVGTINGVNDTFFTLTPYLASSVRLFINGQLLRKGCLTEVSGSSGEIRIETASIPRVGDVVQLAWIDAASAAAECSGLVQVLYAKLEPEESISGCLYEERRLSGYLRTCGV